MKRERERRKKTSDTDDHPSTNWISTNVIRKYVIINELNEFQRPSVEIPRHHAVIWAQINTYQQVSDYTAV